MQLLPWQKKTGWNCISPAISDAKTPKLCKLPFGSITPCISEWEVVRTTMTCCGGMSRKSRRWTERFTWKWKKVYLKDEMDRFLAHTLTEHSNQRCLRLVENNVQWKYFELIGQHRPESMYVSEAPFYLQPIKNPTSDIWFKKQRLGINSLGKLLKKVGEKAELNIRNHSARKTMVTDLCDVDVPGYRIIQL